MSQASNFIEKTILAKVFSYEFCEYFKSTYFYRMPLVAASEVQWTKLASFQGMTSFATASFNVFVQIFCLLIKLSLLYSAYAFTIKFLNKG